MIPRIRCQKRSVKNPAARKSAALGPVGTRENDEFHISSFSRNMRWVPLLTMRFLMGGSIALHPMHRCVVRAAAGSMSCTARVFLVSRFRYPGVVACFFLGHAQRACFPLVPTDLTVSVDSCLSRRKGRDLTQKSVHSVFKHAKDRLGEYIEHLCSKCWAMSLSDDPEKFMDAQRSLNRWRYVGGSIRAFGSACKAATSKLSASINC